MFDIIDLIQEDELIIIKTDPNNLIDIKHELEKLEIKDFLKFDIDLQPLDSLEFDEKSLDKINRMIDKIEENDDVIEIYTNLK